MRVFKVCGFILFSAFLLSGCGSTEEQTSAEQLTVEPYDLSDKEIELVSKTSAGSIEYFKLNGKVDKGNDLVFSVETRKKGKLVGDEVRSSGDYERNYKDTLISFGTSNIGSEDNVLNLMIGVPSGVARTEQPNKMMASTMCRTIDGKIILTKEKPIYLAVWKGTDENSMSCRTGEDGGLPQGLEEADVAYLYKVLWTDAKR